MNLLTKCLDNNIPRNTNDSNKKQSVLFILCLSHRLIDVICVGSVLMKMIVIQFTFQDEESGLDVRGLGFSGTL